MKSTKASEEIHKLKEMSFKDKLWYILEYYKFHIISIFIVIFLLVNVASAFRQKETVLTCYIINQTFDGEQYLELTEGFSAYADLNTSKEEWILDSSVSLDLEDSMGVGYEYFVKLYSVIASKSLDVMISNQDIIDYYSSMSAFWDLEEILPAELLESAGIRLYYATDENGEEKAYAIDLTDSAVLKNTKTDKAPLYFSILANSPHVDMSIVFLKYLMALNN